MHLQGQQYDCAGELIALQTMTNVLNYLKVKDWLCKSKYKFLFQSFFIIFNHDHSSLKVISSSSVDSLPSLFLGLMHPSTPIPLDWLLPFRACMLTFFLDNVLFELIFFSQIFPRKPDMLVGKYISNLIAKPFDVRASHLRSDFLTEAGQGKKWEQENELVPRTAESLPTLSSSNYLPIFFFRFACPLDPDPRSLIHYLSKNWTRILSFWRCPSRLIRRSRESSTIRLPHQSWTRQKMGTREWASAENRRKLAYIILVELLAYLFFFASPVRWIQTQDLLFTISARTGLGSSRSDGVLLLASNLPNDLLPKELAWWRCFCLRSAFWHFPGVINSEEFLKFQSDQQKFAAHVEFGRDSQAREVAFDQEKATSLAWRYHWQLRAWRCLCWRIQPHFDILKARHFNHPGIIGFVKTLCLCTMISFLVGLPPSIEKSLRAALPSLTGLTLTCFNSCSTISISAMLWRETYRLAKEFGQKLIDNTREAIGKPPMYKDGALHLHLVFQVLRSLIIFFLKLLSLLASQRLQRRAQSNIPKLSAKMSANLKPMSRRWHWGHCLGHSRPCMKASCVLWTIPIPTLVPLVAAAVHPPSSFDYKLLTGVGKDIIGVEVVKSFLFGGASRLWVIAVIMMTATPSISLGFF